MWNRLRRIRGEDVIAVASFLVGLLAIYSLMLTSPLPTLEPVLVPLGAPTLLEENGNWTLYFALKNIGATAVDMSEARLTAGGAEYKVRCNPGILMARGVTQCAAEVRPAQRYTLLVSGKQIEIVPVWPRKPGS